MPARRRLHHQHAPRPRPHHSQGRRPEPDDGGALRARYGLLQGQGRLHAHCRQGQGHPRRQRHSRRGPLHLLRRGPLGEDTRHGPGLRLLLRRRLHQPGHLPRVAEHGVHLEAADNLCVRKQPLRHLDEPGQAPGHKGRGRPRRGLQHPRHRRRRQRPAGRV